MDWTTVGFPEVGYVDQQTVAGAGVLITEVETADDIKSSAGNDRSGQSPKKLLKSVCLIVE